MATATEKQLAFIARLQEQKIAEAAAQFARYNSGKGLPDRGRALMTAALIANMPQPSDAADASAQIDALGTGNVKDYAVKRDYGMDVARALAVRYGDKLDRLPESWGEIDLKVG